MDSRLDFESERVSPGFFGEVELGSKPGLMKELGPFLIKFIFILEKGGLPPCSKSKYRRGGGAGLS